LRSSRRPAKLTQKSDPMKNSIFNGMRIMMQAGILPATETYLKREKKHKGTSM
jgi:hypothetical protein